MAISNENVWCDEEANGIELGDKRLSIRFIKLLRGLSQKSELSIPGALDSWSETYAAYRFFSNRKVTAQAILSPHREATLKRIGQEKVALLIQDTSEMNYSSKTDIDGLGPLNTEHHQGFLFHPILVVTPERLCLGSVSNEMWVRESIGNKGLNRDRKIEAKESVRWLKGFQIAEEVARRAPDTLIVNITDREGDIYEFFQMTTGVREGAGAHWLIRSTYNRVASKKEYGIKQGLWDVTRQQSAVATVEFVLPKRGNTASRKVKQEIRFAQVKLGGSRRKGKGLPGLTVTAVLATEINPPEGVKAVEWLLISSLPVKEPEGAVTLLNWYLCRWEIELFFKVLKSGCGIERLQLEHVERLFKCLTLYMIIAWRIMYIKSMGQKYPEESCTLVFSEHEWKSVYGRLNKRKSLPEKPPGLREMVVWVARLGGFLARKNDGNPGVQTLWIGLQRMHDYAQAWDSFHYQKSCV
jgi:Transposase Tn5 dimerisation domain/Transposase DNA-binding